MGAVLGIATGVSALLMYTAGLFVADLEREIGLTRTEFGMGVFLIAVALALANPIVGWAIDRFGVRAPAAAGLVALALGFFALAQLGRSVEAYLALQAITAFFAAASGPVAYTKAVSAWFSRNRGLALGITMTGIGLSAALAPPIVARVIEARGWEDGYRLLGLLALVGLLPLLLLLRLPPSAARAANIMAVDAAAFDRRTFAVMMAAFALMALAFAGLIPHFVPMLRDLGLDPLAAGALAGLIGVAVMVSRLIVGWLVDRVPAPFVAVGVCALCASGCLTLLLAGAPGAYVAAIALGAAMGGEIDLIGFLVARHFRLGSFGRIYGLQYAAFILAAGISPLWMGALYDRQGSYAGALVACIALLAAAALLFLMLPKGERAQAAI
ncbi:MFS transporter [Sphingosinicella terrae]|uniref:MFS transporter n=1 Tax=Sphingosinicella terrae TaxID=2172047 RepID=UPI0013B423DE|nr:MFS transporter [Sphingosinicella terrae]